VAGHRRSGASATLVLTPVDNPAAYGLVETAADGRVLRFIEKPQPDQITTNTINAGIYVLQTETLGLMPTGVNHSIERAFFPALLSRGDRVDGYVHRGYWIDIGTPEKYLQVHRDVLRGAYAVTLDARSRNGAWVHPSATVEGGAVLTAPCFVGPGCRVADGASIGPDAVLCSDVTVDAGARIADSVLWDGCVVGAAAQIDGALLGLSVRVGAHATVVPGSVLGEATVLSDYTRTGGRR
jgi:mannose-1-phosphate guanylyltransferase